MDTKATISNHHRDCLYRQSNVKHARAFQECPTTWNPTRLNSFLMSNPDPWSTQPMGFTGRSSSNVLVQKCNSPDSCDKRKEKRKQISFRGEKKNPNSRKTQKSANVMPSSQYMRQVDCLCTSGQHATDRNKKQKRNRWPESVVGVSGLNSNWPINQPKH